MKKYIEKYFWDFILCVLISAGLSLNLFAGYEMTDPLSGNLFAVAVVVIAVTTLLFLAYYNRRTLVISMIAEAAALIAAIVILQQLGIFSDLENIDGDPLLFWIIVIPTSFAVFWAARTRAGLIILLLAGTMLTSAFDLLVYPVCRWGYFAFVFGAFVLFLYRVYCISLTYSDRGKIAFNVYFAQSVIVCMVALMLASGVYYGIIKPMSPPTDELNLAKRLISMDILEKAGVSSTTIIHSDDPVKTAQNQENNKKQNEQKKEKKIVHGNNPMTVMAVTFRNNLNIIWIAVASIIMMLVLAIIIKLLLRKKWYSNLQKETKEDCAIELYNYFLKKFSKTGLGRPDGFTLLEYASGLQNNLEHFSAGDANFLSLTQIYMSILYGCQKISEDESELFNDFYKEFYRNLKNEMGNFRYLFHFLNF